MHSSTGRGAIAALITFLSMAGPQARAAELCRFQERVDNVFVKNLPSEVIGWADCGHPDRKLNVIYVGKLENPSRADLIAYFKRYEKVIEASHLSTLIRSQKQDTAGLWIELETERSSGTDTHYLFTKTIPSGATLVFIYSDTSERAHNFSGLVKSLRETLVNGGFLSGLEK